MEPAFEYKGIVEVNIGKNIDRKAAANIVSVAIGHHDQDPMEPLLWLISDGQMSRMENEKRNLIKAKVRAIIGTAVFGAGLAISIGTIIGICSKKQN